ncbi:MAG: hypothetical protein DRJ33_04210 [Candidatus Methanomethylicota archaeon]|uniref:Uncharacterized protein n=1 Tax=Thermoproteota archaeon TaxID=2056631 RepID=A0A497EYI8_9CREN|nr:MAG: hypothetical protein DRJ33_04210 [Candidatus Verstraetearchaeota archaeon]
MSSEEKVEIPLTPLGREDIHKLETALLIGTLFRPDVLEMIRSAEERTTWIDSLAVAAGALAREKAKMTTSEIAEDLGRTEATIRNHLTGKTKAGKLVLETYEKFLKEGVKIELTTPPSELAEQVSKLREELDKAKSELEQVKLAYEGEKRKLEEVRQAISTISSKHKELLQDVEKLVK